MNVYILALVSTISSLSLSCDGKGLTRSGIIALPAAPNDSVSAISAVPNNHGELVFYKTDMSPLVDPSTENFIMACLPDLGVCWSTCVATHFPVSRFSVFKSEWLAGDKCVAFAIEYPNGKDIPRLKYWVGEYDQFGPPFDRCTIDVSNPEFDGRGAFATIRIPEGLPSPHPGRRRFYEVHNFYDASEGFIRSNDVMNFRPPDSWDYFDPKLAYGYITPRLVHGLTCVKNDEIQRVRSIIPHFTTPCR